MSPKKRGSALIEFKTLEAPEMAITYEKGDLDNPLTFVSINDAPANRKGQLSGSTTLTDSGFESLANDTGRIKETFDRTDNERRY